MKIEHKPSQIQTSKQFQELEFGIKQADMGLVLEILRSKMYKNPIAAICREVASNSRDANREAENTVPIEISINDSSLNSSDPTITFTDAGPGISQERMADVFVNYGSSTKRSSDDQTGGFGLGAKTPFSYTDNFSIETVVNGTKFSYVAAIEEGSKGKIYLIDQVETQEPSGTSIIIPIKPGDRSSFEAETYKATLFWPIKPIYKNFKKAFDTVKIETIYEDEKFLIVKQDFLNSGYGLLLDGIFYPIESSIMRFANKLVYGHLFISKFSVGELTISANRETLQYDDKTKAAINKRFIELISICKEKYLEEFKKNTTWLQAALFYKKNDSNSFYLLISQHCHYEGVLGLGKDPWFELVNKFNGSPLKSRLDQVFKVLQFYSCECDYNNKVTRTKTTDVNSDLLTVPVVLFDESPSYMTLKDASIFVTNKQYFAVKVLEPKIFKWSELSFKEKKVISKTMRGVIEDIENLSKLGFTYSNYSSVEKMKVTKDAKVKNSIPGVREAIKIYIRHVAKEDHYSSRRGQRTISGFYSRLFSRVDGLHLEGGVGPIDNTKCCLQLIEDVWQEPSITEEIRMLRLAMQLKLIPEFSIIYANKKRGRELSDVFDTYEDKAKLLTPNVITQIIDGSHIREILHDKEYFLTVKYISKKFTNTVTLLKSMFDQQMTMVFVPEDLQKKYENLSNIKGLKQDFLEIFEKCPLLELISNYSYSSNSKNITQYINLIEADLMKKGDLK
jgi:hypothetical protein